MANPSIALPQTANADLQVASNTNSVQAPGADVSKIDASTAKGQDLLASKKQFDSALSELTQKHETVLKAAVKAEPEKAIPGVKLQSEQSAAEIKQQALLAAQEKAKKQISSEAGILGQSAVAQIPNAVVMQATPEGGVEAAAGKATGAAVAKNAKPLAGVPVQHLANSQTQAATPAQAAAAKAIALANAQAGMGVVNPEVAPAESVSELDGSSFSVPTGLGLQEMKFEAGNPESGKAAVSAFATSQAAQKATPVSSTLSTDEYLNLRSSGASLKKAPSKLNLNTQELGTPVAPLNVRDGHAPVATLNAPVTTGSLQKPILSHDAVHQMTQQVSLMNSAKQDGEIKIRLKPDHLGELSMSIKNHGQAISIRIQAQDPEARQIIESSLNSLRDSLSQQNLTVSRMEVTQAPMAAHSPEQSMQMDLGQFRQQQSDTGFQQEQQRESLANRNYWKDEDSSRTPAPVGVTRARNTTQAANGLDLIA